MCCSGLIACLEITKQAIPRNILLPLAVAQGLNLRASIRSHLGTQASCLTCFRLLTVAEVLPTVQTSHGLSSLGSSHSLSSPDPCRGATYSSPSLRSAALGLAG